MTALAPRAVRQHDPALGAVLHFLLERGYTIEAPNHGPVGMSLTDVLIKLGWTPPGLRATIESRTLDDAADALSLRDDWAGPAALWLYSRAAEVRNRGRR